MYIAFRRGPAPLLHHQRDQSAPLRTGTTAVRLRPIILGYQTRRMLSHDPKDPVYVNRIRTIARHYILSSTRDRWDNTERAFGECQKLVGKIIDSDKRRRSLKEISSDLSKIETTLRADACRKTPIWTAQERKAVLEVTNDLRIFATAFCWLKGFAIIGFWSIIWMLCVK